VAAARLGRADPVVTFGVYADVLPEQAASVEAPDLLRGLSPAHGVPKARP
jgi:hypothetical protein